VDFYREVDSIRPTKARRFLQRNEGIISRLTGIPRPEDGTRPGPNTEEGKVKKSGEKNGRREREREEEEDNNLSLVETCEYSIMKRRDEEQ